jgi:hypothetical protein
MSKILRRPMFRGGGKVSSYGTGIASGLAKPKRGLVDEPGGYAGFSNLAQFLANHKQVVIFFHKLLEKYKVLI